MNQFPLLVAFAIPLPSLVEAAVPQSIQKLTTLRRERYARFGEHFALDGDVLIAGNPKRDLYLDTTHYWAGVAHIFERDSMGNWVETSEIISPTPGGGQSFGQLMEIDGDTAMIAQGTNVYAYSREASGSWTVTDTIDTFSDSIAIDGNTAIIGNSYADSTGIYAGIATVYENDGTGNWQQVAQLVGSSVEDRDRFGYQIALKGNIAVVSAHEDELEPDGFNTGTIYVFRKDASGNWHEVSQIAGSEEDSFSDFGVSIAFNGELLVVGATDGARGVGSAYVFECDDLANCEQVTRLTPPNPSSALQFGRATGFIGDQIFIGGVGEVVFYRRDESSSWQWNSSLFPEDLGANQHVGGYLASSGTTLLVGDVLDSTSRIRDAGAIYALEIPEPASLYMFYFSGMIFLTTMRYIRN